MKNFKFLLGAFAVASTALLTSCFSSDDDDTPEAPNVDIVEEAYSVNPSANVPATFTVSKNTNLKKGDVVTVTAKAKENKYDDNTLTKKVKLGDEKSVNVSFVFTIAPTTVVATTTATTVVYVGEDNETTTDVNKAENVTIADVNVKGISMSIPAEAAVAAGKTEGGNNFSVKVIPTASDEEQVDADEMKEGNVDAQTLTVVCKPDGAQFGENPVTITIPAAESNGLEFTARNGETTVSGKSSANSLSVVVPHFSNWDFILKAVVRNYSEKVTPGSTKTMNVSKGNNKFSYTSKSGWNVNRKNVLVNSYLVGKLGDSREKTRTVNSSFNADGDGVVTYRVNQKTVEFDVLSGTSAAFHVTANVGSEVEIVDVTYRPGHSGGNAE